MFYIIITFLRWYILGYCICKLLRRFDIDIIVILLRSFIIWYCVCKLLRGFDNVFIINFVLIVIIIKIINMIKTIYQLH